MLVGSSYPLLDLFWTMLEFFLFFIWIWLIIMIFMDIFRSHDMGGFAKAIWVIFVIILPFLGILVYLIARGGGMHERAIKQSEQQQKAFDDYVKKTAAADSPADQLATLSTLHDQGKLSDDDFAKAKAKIIG